MYLNEVDIYAVRSSLKNLFPQLHNEARKIEQDLLNHSPFDCPEDYEDEYQIKKRFDGGTVYIRRYTTGYFGIFVCFIERGFYLNIYIGGFNERFNTVQEKYFECETIDECIDKAEAFANEYCEQGDLEF